MIKIDKKERDYLMREGFQFGEAGLFKTHTKHPTYYISNSDKIVDALMKYRNKCISGGCYGN